MKYLLFLLLTTILLNSTLAFGQAKNETPAVSEASQIESLRQSGIEALYNLDYDKAQKDFKEITRRYPNHPAGYQLQAAGVWTKTLYESRRLQGSLYSSESFYTSGDDKVDPKIVNEFRSLTREAKRLSEAKLKQDPKNIDALNFLAATEGLSRVRSVDLMVDRVRQPRRSHPLTITSTSRPSPACRR